MSRARMFERIWERVEAVPATSATLTSGPHVSRRLARAVRTAGSLRSAAAVVPALDLDAAWLAVAPRLGGPLVASTTVGATVRSSSPCAQAPARRPVIRRAPVRVAALVAAAAVLLATVSLRAGPGSRLYPVRLSVERVALVLSPNDGGLYARIARARLEDLVSALADGPAAAAPGLARSLVNDRARALEDGADVTGLDREIASEVPPALAEVDASGAQEVRVILGDLLPLPPLRPEAGNAPPGGSGGGSETGGAGPGGEVGSSEGSGHESSPSGGSQESGGSGDTEVGSGDGSGDGGGGQPSEAPNSPSAGD